MAHRRIGGLGVTGAVFLIHFHPFLCDGRGVGGVGLFFVSEKRVRWLSLFAIDSPCWPFNVDVCFMNVYVFIISIIPKTEPKVADLCISRASCVSLTHTETVFSLSLT